MRRNHWQHTVAATTDPDGTTGILDAMLTQHRENFLPDDKRREAGYNRPVAIGFGQTNSQPSTVADMLRLLDVQPGHRVLDVGAGSGWTTAILGELVTETGSVLGLELVPQLAQRAQSALERHDMSWVAVHTASRNVLGAPEAAPFDRMLVSAEPSYLPEELVAQLTPDGIMVINVAGQMLRVRRRGEDPDDAEITQHGMYRFVDLITPDS